MELPPWLALAKAEIGVREVPGSESNSRIIGYARSAGLEKIVSKDEIPWCAAFVGAMFARAGFEITKRADAKSYLKWGMSLNSPVLGCVVVLNRPPVEWQGHVGFYIGRPSAGKIRILGGNQSDMVCEADFDIRRLNQYRWPSGLPIQPRWVGPIEVTGPALQNPNDR